MKAKATAGVVESWSVGVRGCQVAWRASMGNNKVAAVVSSHVATADVDKEEVSA